MPIYLGLGSNLGDRRGNLREALLRLERAGVVVERVSAVVESPALLAAAAPADWNTPFLNCAAECRSSLSPLDLLHAVKQVETRMGRSDARRWSPRPIDIDILVYEDRIVVTDELTIPHPAIAKRSFVLTPLAALSPLLEVPGLDRTVLDLKSDVPQPIPLWMGIINLTPDSFSDGARHTTWGRVETRIDAMIEAGVHIIDLGAESTRPGATELTAEQEWTRLEPFLRELVNKLASDSLRPRISVDTYHAGVARKALDLGADIINDVGGLMSPAMRRVAAESGAEFVAMHNLGLPADPAEILDESASAVDQVEAWLDRQLVTWQAEGLDLGRITFDPGIGFGKNSLQSLELLRNIERLRAKGLRLLVGHSRKSFMAGFSGQTVHDRDLVTIGSSMALCRQKVDVLRVHNVADHISAYRGWSHLQPPPR